MRAFLLLKDLPNLPKGVVFVYDENNKSRLGSLASGCLILAWDRGMCQGGWCGATYVLPGQCINDRDWFAEIQNPQVSDHRGLGDRYHVNIVTHTYTKVS